MSQRIKLSVVMSVFNAELYLKLAMESILNQTFTEFEFIIINDGSSDDSLKIIESFNDERIVLINQTNKGLAMALNNGIEKSRSGLIARMDADDIAMPDRLMHQYNFMCQNPEYVVIGCNATIIDIEGNYVYNSSLPINDYDCKMRLPDSPFIHPAIMFKKEAFYKAGQYPVQMITGQDYVLINRISKFGKFYNTKEALLKYRLVPNSNSLRDNKDNNRVRSIMNKAISDNKISDDDYNFLKFITKNRNSKDSMLNYYLLLAKKYLWNNYQPKLARKNLSKSFQLNPGFHTLMLFLVSFLPSKLILQSYKIMKSSKS